VTSIVGQEYEIVTPVFQNVGRELLFCIGVEITAFAGRPMAVARMDRACSFDADTWKRYRGHPKLNTEDLSNFLAVFITDLGGNICKPLLF